MSFASLRYWFWSRPNSSSTHTWNFVQTAPSSALPAGRHLVLVRVPHFQKHNSLDSRHCISTEKQMRESTFCFIAGSTRPTIGTPPSNSWSNYSHLTLSFPDGTTWKSRFLFPLNSETLLAFRNMLVLYVEDFVAKLPLWSTIICRRFATSYSTTLHAYRAVSFIRKLRIRHAVMTRDNVTWHMQNKSPVSGRKERADIFNALECVKSLVIS
jgi:hypothetical protein